MKITALELVHYPRGIRVHAGTIDWLWVRIHTDEGLTGLGETYLQGILKLLAQGEERVLDAVLHGRLPITIAVSIAGTDDEAGQRILLEAYERKEMRQSTLSAFRKLLEHRKCFGRLSPWKNSYSTPSFPGRC